MYASAQVNATIRLKKTMDKMLAEKEYKQAMDYLTNNAGAHCCETCDYYTGRILIHTEPTNPECVQALKNAARVNYTKDVHFYLGIAYLKNNQFELSRISFDNFCLVANKRFEKSLKVEMWYAKVDSAEIAFREKPVEAREELPRIEEEAVKEDVDLPGETPDTIPKEEAKVVDGVPIEKKNTAKIENDTSLLSGLEYQFLADSINSVINQLENKKLQTEYGDKRSEIVAQIIRLQKKRDYYQKMANRLIRVESKSGVTSGSGLGIEETASANAVVELYDYEVTSNTIPPKGLYYQVQLGVFSRTLFTEELNGLHPVYSVEIKEKGLVKYFFGGYTTVKEVNVAVEVAKSKGFKDSFVVSYYNGGKIPIQKAREIEFSKLME